MPKSNYYQTKTKNWDIKKDKKIKAKHPGRRVSESGNVYYEHRQNRSDINRRIKL